ncbi:hypothetical protein SUSAZ_07900 [Sulfolobus acidocaldarius SUSAZ]|nr:hypothetical protein SUSAZ_07900 [Sulfolobus acidocaldarius SUSAZ]
MKNAIIYLTLLFFSLAGLIALSVNATPSTNNTTLNIIYQRYGSIYINTNYTGLLTNATYTSLIATSALYNTTLSNQTNGATRITYNETAYLLEFSDTYETYSGNISITAKPDMELIVNSQIPYLIRVIVNSSSHSELVWSGITNGTATIDTHAYINGSGNVILEFTNGTSISQLTFNVKANETVTQHVSVVLRELINTSIQQESQGKITVQFNLPRRYSPVQFNMSYDENTSMTAKSNGINASIAYFNGTYVPALVWKGEGLGNIKFGINLLNAKLSSVINANTNFESIEFYGVNGTVIGYVHLGSINGTAYSSLGLSRNSLNLYLTELKIVTVKGASSLQHPQYIGETEIGNNTVVVVANASGQVSSTANVHLSHMVILNQQTQGILASLYINNTEKVIVLTSTNSTLGVEPVVNKTVQQTFVNINGAQYSAEKVDIQNKTGYIIFNVTVRGQGNVTVYKEVNGSLVKLNSENYFMVNGSIVVFDDPATTYYVVYGQPQQTSTGTTTQSNTQTSSSSTSQTTSSSSTSNTSSSPSTQSIPSGTGVPLNSGSNSTPPQSSSQSSNNTFYIVLAVILIIIVIGVVVLLLRRK